MEGLLPVIIALVISAIFGMRKKKSAPEQAPRPEVESPWDDLLRELQQKEKPQPQAYVPRQEDPQEESEEVRPYFTYEDIPQAQPLSYEAPEPVAIAEPLREQVPALPERTNMDLTPPLQGSFRVEAAPEEPALGGSVNEPEEGAVFASGFDPRMAVLYSEVLRPKYLD